MLSSKEKSYLRSMSNTLDPIIHIGKGGITDTVVEAVNQALTTRELIKIRVLPNCLDSASDLAPVLAERTQSQLVQQLGKKIVLYRHNPENPVINLPGGGQ